MGGREDCLHDQGVGRSVRGVGKRDVRAAAQARVEENAVGGVGAEVLPPAVRAAVRWEVGSMAYRFAHLLARGALESAATRRPVYRLLVRELGVEDARRANEAAWTGRMISFKSWLA